MSWWQRFFSGSTEEVSELRAVDNIEERLRLAQRLLTAAEAVTNVAPLDSTAALLDRMVDHVSAAFGATHACIHFTHDGALPDDVNQHGMRRCPVHTGAEDRKAHLASLEQLAITRAQSGGRPIQMSQMRTALQELADVAHLQDGIIVPLSYAGDVFGSINVYVPHPYRFDELDQTLLRTVGGVLYGAIKKEAYVGAIQRIRAVLETHFSPQVVEKLISNPESLAEQRYERLDVTVVFTDIRGYTALAHRLTPDEVANLVSEHVEAMSAIVFEYGGIVDKYIGDSVMAVFGSPFPQGDHARRAVAAAVAMVARQRALQDRWGDRVGSPLAIGVGVNTGEVSAGDVGISRREFTHLGDTVNLASRLKDAALPWQVLINQSTYARIHDVVLARALEPFQVKGKPEPIIAFEVTGYRGPLDELREPAGTPT